ncbi:hypothetical protein C9374_005446 [Naegleria lovaniensis]|uniref:Methyltransferase domain-containing protein n=1 Tax=Naegleria lovaniensis TaxID=51637 RepID=A0AA88GJQ5_NAELO|nr:uncharacterized protein C9374_005446 [Naegleria lovaniensis]KAG2382244.1 hypothetical protein C9374_005446 [Naegleria lovaniensis]
MTLTRFVKALVYEASTPTTRVQERIPEPELVMNDSQQVKSYMESCKRVMTPVYLFCCAQVANLIQPGMTVLDLGCGSGAVLCMIASMHPESEFIGFDLSENMLQHAQAEIDEMNLKNVKLVKGDMTDFLEQHGDTTSQDELTRFKQASFDVVMCTNALHHLPDEKALQKCFANISQVLKKEDGSLYLLDFLHVRSEKTMHLLSHFHEEEQEELFTQDYANSLKAAFFKDQILHAMKSLPSDGCELFTTFGVSFLFCIKKEGNRSSNESSTKLSTRHQETLLQMKREMIPSKALQHDLEGLKMLFKLGGLRTNYL